MAAAVDAFQLGSLSKATQHQSQSNSGLTRLSKAIVKSIGSTARHAFDKRLSDWDLRPVTRNMIKTTKRSLGDL